MQSLEAAAQFFFHTEMGHDLLAMTVIIAVQSLDAPTKDSSAFYRYFFRFAQAMVGQFKRMFPKVEASPNFQDAMDIQTKKAGLPPIDAIPPPPGHAAGEEPKP